MPRFVVTTKKKPPVGGPAARGLSWCQSEVISVRGVGREGVEKALELLAPHRVLQLADGLGFDLADAFAGHFEDAAHLFQGVGVTVTQAVPQLDDLAARDK